MAYWELFFSSFKTYWRWNSFLLSTLKKKSFVSYDDNNKGNILSFSIVDKFSNPTIGGVLFVEWIKYNLLSINQLSDKGNNVTFDSSGCRVIKSKSNQTLFTSSRSGNTYTINLNKIPSNDVCLPSNENESWLWRVRVSHIHIDHLNMFVSKDLVVGLSDLHLKNNRLCYACQKGKQVQTSYKEKNIISINHPLHLLNMDLVCPFKTISLSGNVYTLVVMDDYSGYTWTLFLY